MGETHDDFQGTQQERIGEYLVKLKDSWKPTRTDAAQRLAEEGDAVVPTLRAAMLVDEPDWDLAEYGVWILEQIGSPAAEEVLDAWWERHG